MSDLERKFGKYAVRDLSLKLIILYLAGYAIFYINPQILYYMTLNPYAIVHGQIWRIVSWLLIPPQTSNLFFVAIMLFFYYSIGTSLERVWGTWRYNVFIFTGILLTVAAAFVWMGSIRAIPAARRRTISAIIRSRSLPIISIWAFSLPTR